MSKLIVNCETGEQTIGELTKAEIDQQKIDEAEIAAQQAEAQAKATAKAALLTQLGITEEQAKLLLS
jgi:hypothetical protein